jgi:cytochrome c oxidase cbb3-type subunit 2
MTRFRTFVLGLAVTFFVPWFFLIAKPYAKLRAMEPVVYDAEEPALGSYPAAISNISKQGARVYAREGCVQCHTQMIRPDYLGTDPWKKNWGKNESEGLSYTRPTQAMDYYGEELANLGVERNGPDLANYAYRAKDLSWIHEHLFDAREHAWYSVMPSFRHLYQTRKIQGEGSANALNLKGKHAPAEGYEVVPGPNAEALVDYLTTRKKDAQLPAAFAEEKAAAAAKKS